MCRQIPNTELRIGMIPNANDGHLIEFAHTFNAYNHWEAYEKSVNVAEGVTKKLRAGQIDQLSMTEIRTLLFVYARSLRMIFTYPDSELETMIVEALKGKVLEGSVE